MSDAPIFIVGANRSGTTLVRLVLNAHSRIAIPEELTYLDSFLGGVPIEHWRAPGLSPSAYAAFVDACLDAWLPVLPELDREPLRTAVLDGPANFRVPYATVLRAWANYYGKARFGEKTPGNLFYADVLYAMFPEAHFIHVVRDPRAGVASMQRVDFFPQDVVFNALSRRKHMTTGRKILERAVPAEQQMTVRYENLVDNPVNTVRRLCTFLGEAYEPAMLAFHRDADRFMKEEASSSFNAAATRPISSGRIDSWRRHLSHADQAIIETICAADMAEFGYVADSEPLSMRTRLDLWVKRAYWALQSWRNRRLRHYTVKHPMFAGLHRRLRRFAPRPILGRDTS